MLIIDANIAGEIKNAKECVLPVVEWLVDGGGKVAVGGRNLDELSLASLSRFLVQLERAGRLMRFDKQAILDKEKQIRSRISSDDPHVIALALVSKTRLLVSNDQLLIQDFKSSSIMGGKPGKVFKTDSPGDKHKRASLFRNLVKTAAP